MFRSQNEVRKDRRYSRMPECQTPVIPVSDRQKQLRFQALLSGCTYPRRGTCRSDHHRKAVPRILPWLLSYPAHRPAYSLCLRCTESAPYGSLSCVLPDLRCAAELPRIPVLMCRPHLQRLSYAQTLRPAPLPRSASQPL